MSASRKTGKKGLGHTFKKAKQTLSHAVDAVVDPKKKKDKTSPPESPSTLAPRSVAEPAPTVIPRPHPAPLTRTYSLSGVELTRAMADSHAIPAPIDPPPALPAHVRSASAPVVSTTGTPPPLLPRPSAPEPAKPLLTTPKTEKKETGHPEPGKKQTTEFVIPDAKFLAAKAAERAERAAAQMIKDQSERQRAEELRKEEEAKKEKERKERTERRTQNALAALGRGPAAKAPSATAASPRQFQRKISKPPVEKTVELTPIAETAIETSVTVLTEVLPPSRPSSIQPPPMPTAPPPSVAPAPLNPSFPVPQPPVIPSKEAVILLKEKIATFTGSAFVAARVKVDASVPESDPKHQDLLNKELAPITDLSSHLNNLQDDLAKDMANQKDAGKSPSEINASDAGFICQKAKTLIDELASEKTYEEKLIAIVDFKTQCQQKKSGWKKFGEIVASIAIAAVSFAFVAASAIAVGVAFSAITFPTGPGVVAGVLAGITAGASWAIGILTGSGVLAAGLGAGSAIAFFKPSARDCIVKDIAADAKLVIK